MIKSNVRSTQTLKQNENEKLVRAFTSNNLKYSQQFKREKEKEIKKKSTITESQRRIVIKKVFQSPNAEKALTSLNPRNIRSLKSESKASLTNTKKEAKPLKSSKQIGKSNVNNEPLVKQVKWVSTKEVIKLIVICKSCNLVF